MTGIHFCTDEIPGCGLHVHGVQYLVLGIVVFVLVMDFVTQTETLFVCERICTFHSLN